jgi:hypothetical protein
MAQPLGKYSESVGKREGTEVALPKRVVHNIAIMPSDSCCELKMLFERGLIADDATIWCYENGRQVAFEAMEKAVRRVVGQYWTKAKIDKQIKFINSNIIYVCLHHAYKDVQEKFDWVYLDFCGVVDIDILAIMRKYWPRAGMFTDDAEISVTSCHKLRYKSRELTPMLVKLAGRASKVGAYARGGNANMHDVVIGTQVGIAEALPFGVTVRESLTYGRGMTTTRFARVAGKKPVSGVFTAKVVNARPKWARGMTAAQWAWHPKNPTGIRRVK